MRVVLLLFSYLRDDADCDPSSFSSLVTLDTHNSAPIIHPSLTLRLSFPTPFPSTPYSLTSSSHPSYAILPLTLLTFLTAPLPLALPTHHFAPAISHAMARDGSSGGVIRLVTIDQTGVAKEVVLGDRLPFMP